MRAKVTFVLGVIIVTITWSERDKVASLTFRKISEGHFKNFAVNGPELFVRVEETPTVGGYFLLRKYELTVACVEAIDNV